MVTQYNDIAHIITPPSTIGIMGGGQLARMLAIAAKQMGYKIAILEPSKNCPAHLFADYHIISGYTDETGLDQLANLCSVITTEFENVPSSSMKYLGTKTSVFPSSNPISIAQNRLLEKNFFNKCGIKTTPYVYIEHSTDISNINDSIFPAILKTNTLGYDGKGQIHINNKNELVSAFTTLGNTPCIIEKIVNLKLEVSIMVARNSFETICYPIVQNQHKHGILDMTIAGVEFTTTITDYINQSAKNIIEKLDYIGILGIEFFITENNEVLCNEMSPRPHNSGHYTIDACVTSQFEQQVRAICNLKLGSTKLFTKAVMLNLLGDIWHRSQEHPKWQNILTKYENLKLHLYDKEEAKSGRKMGHLIMLGNDLNLLLKQVEDIKQTLGIAL